MYSILLSECSDIEESKLVDYRELPYGRLLSNLKLFQEYRNYPLNKGWNTGCKVVPYR